MTQTNSKTQRGRTMESDGFIYFQLNINFDGQRTESTFIKCKPKQTIGDAIFDNMADENVAIVKVQTVSPPNKTRADTPTSTPVEVLASFGAKIIFVDVNEGAPPEKSGELLPSSFNAEEFVNDTKGFGNIVGATMDSIHHMHIEIEEKEHIIEEIVTVLAVLPTENEAEMENVLEASNQISKEEDGLSDNVQDALLNVMDKISDKISHTDVNKSEPGKVENMVKSLFDSSSNLLDLNHVPERNLKEKVIVEDKSETEDVIHVEETEPEQEVPYESPEEQQETQVQETEAEIKAREKKIERTKKLLHTVDIIADSALKTLSDDEPKTMEFSTKTMNLVVGVSKLNNSTNTSTDISTSRKIGNKTVTSSFKLPPEIKEQLKEASKNGFKFQMLFSDKNPRSWDKSSAYINSPMISLILKDLNQKTLGVTKLPKPIIIDIPIGRKEKYSEFILNSQEDNFIRLKVKQPANMFYMLKLMTDGPQYNISVKIAIEFHKQVSLLDAENGTLISNTHIAFLKEPGKKSLYWSLGIIINERSDGNISQNISVKISSTAINCRYWNNTNGKWLPDGCKVSPVSSSETLECECDHLTDFAGGVFVLPNIVDPFQDALLFLTFFDNPVVVTVVILVWLIYFLGLYRARQADRKDSNFDGIVTPFPSDPSDPFKYVMCIVTGWRYDARTTANVSCYIKGNHGQSARHCLSRTSSPQVLFTSGGEDWFLITSSYDIGDMVNVIVWHDNSGSSPSWFLSRIIIQDVQTKKVFNFYYDNWLGIQSGTAKVCLSIKSGYELKQQFFLRTSQDLRRGHLWISIISKPPCSNFTRAQRLSCALSLLFCTMLSCLMFHGIPTDETISSDVASIQFEFSLKDFIIGLQSSIIMFPINFAIIELFVRSKTKQLHKERYMEIDVNRPTASDEKGSDKKDNEIVAVKRWM
ncbi:PKD1L2 [Mytilus edulis]|uniref:PKD1L2 n=1 Tax=Mytilus edulis TaxID=6550 RepID=A0A8S3TFD9_MYTED|nr:PKD1L2 [Mytilus edulis]